MNFLRTRKLLQEFKFADLFILELGWSYPEDDKTKVIIPNPTYVEPEQPASDQPQPAKLYGEIIAQLAHVPVIQIECKGQIFSADMREKIRQKVAERYYKHLLIFVTKDRTCSLWYWEHHTHWYFKGQPGDLFLSKLSAMIFSMADFEQGDPTVREVCKRLDKALDVSQVTKDFYEEFRTLRAIFTKSIQGIDDLKKQRWYASVILNRIIFIYFLQKKGFLDHQDFDYLSNKLEEIKGKGKDLYYREFLRILFLKGFAKPKHDRTQQEQDLLGDIRYLNGGLFLEHEIEKQYGDNIQIPDSAFSAVFALLGKYSWALNDLPGTNDKKINPAVLGYIFEKWVNDRSFGAYYTREEITDYLCEQTIARVIMEKVSAIYGADQFDDVHDVIAHLNPKMALQLVTTILPSIKILDPACGSGAFLLAGMKTLFEIYCAIVSKDFFEKDNNLRKWRDDLLPKPNTSGANLSGSGANLSGAGISLSSGDANMPGAGISLSGSSTSLSGAALENSRPILDPRIAYMLKKQIIINNLFGVDIEQEATEIARLRLFLELVSSAEEVNQLEPLPNSDFNIMHGNSLIGLMRIQSNEFDTRAKTLGQANLFPDGYQKLLEEKRRWIRTYRNAVQEDTRSKPITDPNGTDQFVKGLTKLRDDINGLRKAGQEILDALLQAEFTHLKIKFEQVQWDTTKNKKGKSIKREITIADIEALTPFHWGFEFDEIMQMGGFDVVLTNPPWEVFMPQAKEFFCEYCREIAKNKMKIHDFEHEQARLLREQEILEKWEKYLSNFPHVSEYYRKSPQYPNQISIQQSQADEDGNTKEKKIPNDVNLYKLFLEQCFHLLRPNGQCGVVIPSGIYTDLSAKQLRQMLFEQTQITGLFCFENRQGIFERIDSRFKFVALSFQKGCATVKFLAAFMRHDVKELESFLKQYAGYRKGLGPKIIVPGMPNSVANLQTGAANLLAGADNLQTGAANLLAGASNLQTTTSPAGQSVGTSLSGASTSLSNGDAKQKDLGVVMITTDLIRRLSPDSLSIMEFKTALDFTIAEKMLRFPLLGKKLKNTWNVSLTQEFNMTSDSDLFQTKPGPCCLPLYEGKMIHQFCHNFASPRYWIQEDQGRARILGRTKDTGQVLDYQMYRLGFRKVAGSTNQRTMIATILLPCNFCPDSMTLIRQDTYNTKILVCLCAIFGSFVLDYAIRQKITANLNFFYVYQLPVPRLTAESKWFAPIVARAGRLICTTPEFNALAQDIGLPPLSGGNSLPDSAHNPGSGNNNPSAPVYGITDSAERESIRAELDGLIAHLYGLSRDEFGYILTTFPQVEDRIKQKTLTAYHNLMGHLPE